MDESTLRTISWWLFSLLSSVGVAQIVGAEGTVERATAPKIEWSTDYQKSQKAAEEQHKPLFLLFTGSNWCNWCMRLEQEVLTDSAFAEAVGDQFLFVKIDFPRGMPMDGQIKQQNDQLQKQFRVKGFPTVVLLDEHGAVIGTTGYRRGGGESYATHLKAMIN